MFNQMNPKYSNMIQYDYSIYRMVIFLLFIIILIPEGVFAKKKPFKGKDRYNRQISEGIENNGDTLSVTYIAFHPFQIDTTKMAVNKNLEFPQPQRKRRSKVSLAS